MLLIKYGTRDERIPSQHTGCRRISKLKDRNYPNRTLRKKVEKEQKSKEQYQTVQYTCNW